MKYIIVGMGGAIGTLLRFYITSFIGIPKSGMFPWGTFSVNLTGSLLIGLIAGITSVQNISAEFRFFVFIGVLEGYTTFSVLAIEGLDLIRNGNFLTAVTYTISSIFLDAC